MTPESRIAADLGLTTADLTKLAADHRARKLAPKVADYCRRLASDPTARLALSCVGMGDELDGIIAELDARPVAPPPLVRLGPGGDFTRDIR
jgi:hypothetical protein